MRGPTGKAAIFRSRIDAEAKTNGIIIPDTAQEKPQGNVTAAKLPDQIASVFLLLALFGKKIDYLLSIYTLGHTL